MSDQITPPEQETAPSNAHANRTVVGWQKAPEDGGGGAQSDHIGPYRLLEKLGEGGMGSVFLAEQTRPIRRRVALKLTHGSANSERMLQRFDAERQALALMSHPNIAKVFDAGSSESGEPYFVMEYVDGREITDYCDTGTLGIRARLELMIAVCDGVQHAHQKGILHRDLKPSNVLVESNGHGVPKIIDFGIAKALDDPLTDGSQLTRDGGVVGTPAYMAPERLRAESGVDTRADIYSLGVMLYELLTGELPHAPEGSSFYDVAERVLTGEVSRPSGKLTSLTVDRLEKVASGRGIGSGELGKRLRGDLDWITMRAMERDPERRYASAAELAADIRRHLANEPVEAGPPGAAYRMGKFIRRHTVGVASGAVVVLALIGGIVGTTVQAARANREAARAEREASAAQEVSDFLVGMFEVADPSESRGETITAREILDRGAERISEELEEQPLTQARLLETLGTVYGALGLYDEAESFLKDSLSSRQELLGTSDPELIDGEIALSWLLQQQGKYDLATQMMERIVATRIDSLGEDHRLVALAKTRLGGVYLEMGRFDEAEELHLQAITTLKKTVGVEHPDLANALHNLAMVYFAQHRLTEAEAAQESAVSIDRKALGPDHPELTSSLNNLADIYSAQQRFEEAAIIYTEVLETNRRVLGPQHPMVAASLHNLAIVYLAEDRLEDAERAQREALEIGEATVGPDHPYLALGMMGLGDVLNRQGRFDEAEPLLERAISIWESSIGPEHHRIAFALVYLADVHQAHNNAAAAEAAYRRGLQIVESNFGPDDQQVAIMLQRFGAFLRLHDREAEAAELETRAATIIGA